MALLQEDSEAMHHASMSEHVTDRKKERTIAQLETQVSQLKAELKAKEVRTLLREMCRQYRLYAC